VEIVPELLGSSREIAAVREQIARLLSAWARSRRPPPVLIQGETGTGKGLLAKSLHPASPRAAGPFVALNCAAIPESLLEAELFGYEPGAFTDARKSKPGLFQLAHGGTLFLDEIALLPLTLQAKLLAVLEDRSVRRLGGTRMEPADVWIIAATNEDLTQALRERRFREDLYHRVAVLTVVLPPLRARGDDGALLAERFLARACAEYELPPKRLSADALAAIAEYPWPGNVRELGNVIERAALLAGAPEITAADLGLSAVPRPDDPAAALASPAAVQSSSDVARDHLARVLGETDWNISRTAAILGVSRNTVTARIVRFGLRGPRKSGSMLPAGEEVAAIERLHLPPAVPRGATWEKHRLVFLRLEVVEEREGEDLAASEMLSAAAEKIGSFGGRVEGVGPRALLAMFGLESGGEHAMLAAHCALVIRHALGQRPPNAARVTPRIGLHTADVMVSGSAGVVTLDAEASRQAWNAVELAMAGVEPGTIVATAPVAALLRRRFSVAPGVRDGTHVIRGLWRNDVEARRQRGVFAGRQEELALLESRFAAVAQGSTQVVAIAGEAGMGKSRLLIELVSSPRLAHARYLEGRCLPTEVQVPFFPLLQIIGEACDIGDADPPPVVERKLREALGVDGPAADETVASLLYLMGASASPPEAPGVALKKRLFASIRQLLLARSAAAPMLVVVEDLQWIDPSSEECLATLVDGLGQASILLAMTYQTGYRPPWAGAARVLQLTLAPLPSAECLAIIRAVLDAPSYSLELERRIQSWAEGNPLFLEELSRAAREHADGSVGSRIPATIEDTINSRLRRLPIRLRRVLAGAAVIGRDVPASLLRAVTDLEEEALETAAAQLARADFLYPSWLGGGESRYTFKHGLVQETAYANLPASECRQLHRRVLDALEALHPGRLADHVERLAHHAVLAADHDRAVRYLRDAAQKAAERFALAEARSHLGKGLALLPQLPEGPERDRRELALRVADGMVSSVSVGPGAAETALAFDRAAELRQRVPDAPAAALLVGQWYSFVMRSSFARARDVAAELRRVAERDGDPQLGAIAHQSLGMTALFCGELLVARRHLERALDLRRGEEPRAPVSGAYGWPLHISHRVTCLAYLGRVLFALGYPDQALARNREAVAEAQAGGGALNQAIALGMLTSAYQLRRETARAREASEKQIAHASEWGIGYWHMHGLLHQCVTRERHVGSALQEHGLDVYQTLDRYRATGTTLGVTWFLVLIAETHAACGEILEGLKAADEALALARATGESYHLAECERVRGTLLLRHAPDGVAAAEQAFLRAIELARAQEARGWELRAAIDLARLLQGAGRRAEARAVVEPVSAWFTEGFDTPDLVDARAVLGGGDRAPS
jgi:transcriptional regulator with AAA-type ATPase domain/predicted ATPase